MVSLFRRRVPASASAAAAESGDSTSPSPHNKAKGPSSPEPPNCEQHQQPQPQQQQQQQPRQQPPPPLLRLPPELHLLISRQLLYPDALSLKHTSRHFGALVDTGVRLKVEWLMQRRSLHLECPNDRRCDLGSDLKFCRGSVTLLMRRRREHLECETRPGLGCLVLGTPACEVKRSRRARGPAWWRGGVRAAEGWWVWALLVLLGVCLSWLWGVVAGAVRSG